MPMACHKLSHEIFFSTPICLACQHKNINKIENKLNEDFCNIYHWFVDNKLGIHFGENKTKSILFDSKFKRKNIKELHIKYGDIQVKQHSKVKYLGYLLDETMSGDTMVLNIVNNINNMMKFLYCKNSFLTPALRCLLSNALISIKLSDIHHIWDF